MQKRLRIINSTELTPSDENYVILGVGILAMSGAHSNERYIDHCHELNKGTLVYNR